MLSQTFLTSCTTLVQASFSQNMGSGISGIPQSSFCCAIAPLRSGSVCSRRSAAIARSRLSSFVVEGRGSVDSVREIEYDPLICSSVFVEDKLDLDSNAGCYFDRF